MAIRFLARYDADLEWIYKYPGVLRSSCIGITVVLCAHCCWWWMEVLGPPVGNAIDVFHLVIAVLLTIMCGNGIFASVYVQLAIRGRVDKGRQFVFIAHGIRSWRIGFDDIESIAVRLDPQARFPADRVFMHVRGRRKPLDLGMFPRRLRQFRATSAEALEFAAKISESIGCPLKVVP